ncbi:C4-dicarboxylate transporter/malic acid transport protein [Actinacidiphila cocklensis]|uniref:C4-dicarboxylate transporter/malic acid transport protein n=2 Tax=Actinacidiphila cocklensis TaxID=887465 RepID=A0A9W4GTV1_9ACTN|nr:C4-dicarboxylate transporter/malic acid transport protein [Actinacidiphila cocklensis]
MIVVGMVTVVSARPGVRTAGVRFSSRNVGPNWYAAVMGTSIVGSAGAAVPGSPGWLRAGCTGVWVLAAALLGLVLAARAAHWAGHLDEARRQLLDPAVAPFYGCLPMALLSVGGGALTLGPRVIGEHAAVTADAALWTAGTVSALLVAAGVPYLMVTRHRIGAADASPVWLLPVVAPMVAAALGPALVPHLPAGARQAREALLLGCYAMFGLSLLATLMLLPLVWGRLLRYGPLPVALTPALFLVLGPLGQSTTAAGALADAGPYAVAPQYATALRGFAVLYGVPVMGFALLWLAMAAAMALRAARRGLRFSMTWWAFTFPVGTCATGAAALARHTGLHAASWLAVVLYVALVAAWAAAAAGTLHGLLTGTLPAPAAAPAPQPAVAAAGTPQPAPADGQPAVAAASAAARTVGAVASEGPYQVR